MRVLVCDAALMFAVIRRRRSLNGWWYADAYPILSVRRVVAFYD